MTGHGRQNFVENGQEEGEPGVSGDFATRCGRSARNEFIR
jgi:hypothetical protein